jgi:chromosome segregation ATPase
MVKTIMSETIALSELQIKRRELENELASLSQKEKSLENGLRTLEEKIIDQLKEDVKAKKSVLSNLESRKSDLEKKLNELQGKTTGSQTAEEQEHNTEENDTELTVVGYQQE